MPTVNAPAARGGSGRDDHERDQRDEAEHVQGPTTTTAIIASVRRCPPSSDAHHNPGRCFALESLRISPDPRREAMLLQGPPNSGCFGLPP